MSNLSVVSDLFVGGNITTSTVSTAVLNATEANIQSLSVQTIACNQTSLTFVSSGIAFQGISFLSCDAPYVHVNQKGNDVNAGFVMHYNNNNNTSQTSSEAGLFLLSDATTGTFDGITTRSANLTVPSLSVVGTLSSNTIQCTELSVQTITNNVTLAAITTFDVANGTTLSTSGALTAGSNKFSVSASGDVSLTGSTSMTSLSVGNVLASTLSASGDVSVTGSFTASGNVSLLGDNISIGSNSANSTVTIFGNTQYINSTQLQVKDSLVSYNKGGTDASAIDSGFEVLGAAGTAIASFKTYSITGGVVAGFQSSGTLKATSLVSDDLATTNGITCDGDNTLGSTSSSVLNVVGQLKFDTSYSKKLTLYDSNGTSNNYQYTGLNVDSNECGYNIQDSTSSHIFYAGLTSTSKQELLKIKGTKENSTSMVTGTLILPSGAGIGCGGNIYCSTLNATTLTATNVYQGTTQKCLTMLSAGLVTSSGTFTIPTDIYRVKITCIGGGGGGSTGNSGGSGGGGGAGSIKYLTVIPLTTLTITIGAGAALGAQGGTTSVTYNSVVVCSAAGGSGAPTNTYFNIGGIGGDLTSGVGDVRVSGMGGEGGANDQNRAGGGGSSGFGFGGGGYGGSQANGGPGGLYGGGGAAYKIGAQGVVLIEY